MIEAVFETWVAPELEVVDEVVVEVLVSAVVVLVSVVVHHLLLYRYHLVYLLNQVHL